MWSANLNFGYVPFYGKFALFDRWIFQWEGYVQAGLGVIQTEWITRDPADRSATNYDIQWHVDVGMRLFLTKWLAIHAYLKDYMFVDSLEPASRGSAVGTAAAAQGRLQLHPEPCLRRRCRHVPADRLRVQVHALGEENDADATSSPPGSAGAADAAAGDGCARRST